MSGPARAARGEHRAGAAAGLAAVLLASCLTARPPASASAPAALVDPTFAATAAAVEPEGAATTAPIAGATPQPEPEGAGTAAAVPEVVGTTAGPGPGPGFPGGKGLTDGLPPPLPPPEPPPLQPPIQPPPASELADPLEVLWGHRLDFSSRGEPLVSIRLMEGQREIVFRARGAARVGLRGGGAVEIPAGARLTVRARRTAPAAIVHHPLLAEAPLAERESLEPVRRSWEARGVMVLSRVEGVVYGIGGRVVDNRRELLLAASDGSEAGARRTAEALREPGGAAPALHAEVVARPRGTLELRADGGAPLGEADAALWLEVEGDGGFVVEGVEHERSPTARAREDRAYHGRLYVTLDARGALTAVHGVALEELLRALVPSEMPASSHLEALRAQAVTARSNVLAQIGTRHLTDPFMLCAEVHCQAYRGDAARTARTDEAVRSTRGEALFRRADRVLVDAVYSAMCGGHGEDNDQVWANAPSPSLRGRPDLPPEEGARWARALGDEGKLRAFLAAAPDAWCRRATAARKDRFRWERRLAPADLDAALAPLGVGFGAAARRARARRVGSGAPAPGGGRRGAGRGRRGAPDPAAPREPPLGDVRRGPGRGRVGAPRRRLGARRGDVPVGGGGPRRGRAGVPRHPPRVLLRRRGDAGVLNTPWSGASLRGLAPPGARPSGRRRTVR